MNALDRAVSRCPRWVQVAGEAKPGPGGRDVSVVQVPSLKRRKFTKIRNSWSEGSQSGGAAIGGAQRDSRPSAAAQGSRTSRTKPLAGKSGGELRRGQRDFARRGFHVSVMGLKDSRPANA